MYSIPSTLDQPILIASRAVVLPLLGDRVCAGFPSPAADLGAKRIDLTAELIVHPQATYLLRVSGDSMKDAHIFDGDVLVVDRAVKPLHGHICVAVVDGEFTVKYLYMRNGRFRLRAANPTYPDIVPREGQTVEVWGVVRHTIRHFHV
ncbi:translesion error-prone DNA polymerase V autoproteolytic subunit [bacterium]|nr:MAG: translesion error-prone DNA polymerase V autoproteolytic subunit [bacterium]